MLLPIIQYGNPILRKPGKPIQPQTHPNLQTLIQDMLQTMRHAQGIGLAAHQIAQPIQLTVIDTRAAQTDNPTTTLTINNQPTDPNQHMPLILINPKIQIPPNTPNQTQQEGCLSFPDIYAPINRPTHIQLHALQPNAKPIQIHTNGILARVIQHETDHLNGILFIDRITPAQKNQLRPQLQTLHHANQPNQNQPT